MKIGTSRTVFQVLWVVVISCIDLVMQLRSNEFDSFLLSLRSAESFSVYTDVLDTFVTSDLGHVLISKTRYII